MASMSLWMCTYVYWYLFIIITRLTKVCLVWVCVWQHARRKHTHSLKYNKPSSLTNFLFSVCLSEWSRQTFSYSIMVQIYSACSYACVCLPCLPVHDSLLSPTVCSIYFLCGLFTSQSEIHHAHVHTDPNRNVCVLRDWPLSLYVSYRSSFSCPQAQVL